MNPIFAAKLKYTFWVALSFVIGIFLAFVATESAGYEKLSQEIIISSPPVQNQVPEIKKLEFFYFIKDPTKQPKIKAEAYFVGDLDTGEVILKKNENSKFPIASISKLMTAAVSTESQNREGIIKVSARAIATQGKNGGLSINEKIKTGDLLYPLLLESSNDAAEAIAEHSGRHTFIEKMNDKAKAIGLVSTSFRDPSGLSEFNVSTALDLFRFSQYLKTNEPNILLMTTKRSFGNKKHTWFNGSQFLGMDGYAGGKRGYIDESKQTVVSFFSIPLGISGTRNIGITVLRSPDRLKDVQNIFNYLKKNVYYGLEADANLAWVKNKEGAIEEAEPNFVTLLFGGDIMLDRGVKNSVMKNFGGDYSALFDNLGILKKVDIAFANLEGPASDQGKDMRNLYSFRMNPSVIPVLKGAGLSIVSVANNHIGDWGRPAYEDTLARLKENEILYTGGGINSQEAETPTIIEKYGIKIGYLAFSDKGPDWMEATADKSGILLANNPRFNEIITKAAKQVDYLIVSFHFGDEYQTKHNTRQEYLAHKAIDNGAKIIIGHHPHVIQNTEIYNPKSCTQSSCMGFIAYSLGNLIFDQYFSVNTMQGMLLGIKLYKDGSMETTKNIVKLNSSFQPDKIIKGKNEKVKFVEVKVGE